jgi:hypothetical protein
MPGINTLLLRGQIRHDMRDELVTSQTQRQRLFCPPSDGTPKAIRIEPKRGVHVMNRKGEVKQTSAHRNWPFTTGSPFPSHHTAIM